MRIGVRERRVTVKGLPRGGEIEVGGGVGGSSSGVERRERRRESWCKMNTFFYISSKSL